MKKNKTCKGAIYKINGKSYCVRKTKRNNLKAKRKSKKSRGGFSKVIGKAFTNTTSYIGTGLSFFTSSSNVNRQNGNGSNGPPGQKSNKPFTYEKEITINGTTLTKIPSKQIILPNLPNPNHNEPNQNKPKQNKPNDYLIYSFGHYYKSPVKIEGTNLNFKIGTKEYQVTKLEDSDNVAKRYYIENGFKINDKNWYFIPTFYEKSTKYYVYDHTLEIVQDPPNRDDTGVPPTNKKNGVPH